MFIQDGKGKGLRVGVNSKNRLLAAATSTTIEHSTNQLEELAFNLLFEQAPTANDDAIIYIENSHELDLVLEGILLSVSAACEVYITLANEGTRNAASNIIPKNLNSGAGKDAQGTFEVGADLDGAAVTLNAGVEVERYIFRAANNSTDFNFNQDIILKKNRTLVIWCDTAGVTVNGRLAFNYHDGEDE